MSIIVKARAGVLVPIEDNPHRYVTDECAVTVPDSAYYRRRIADGDLIPAPKEDA